MGLLTLLGAIILTIIAVTSVICAIATLVVIVTTIEDKEQKFLSIYALLGWLVLGMWLISFFN